MTNKTHIVNMVSLLAVLFVTAILVALKMIGVSTLMWIWTLGPLWIVPLLAFYIVWATISIEGIIMLYRKEETRAEIIKKVAKKQGIKIDHVPVAGVCQHDLTGMPEA